MRASLLRLSTSSKVYSHTPNSLVTWTVSILPQYYKTFNLVFKLFGFDSSALIIHGHNTESLVTQHCHFLEKSILFFTLFYFYYCYFNGFSSLCCLEVFIYLFNTPALLLIVLVIRV